MTDATASVARERPSEFAPWSRWVFVVGLLVAGGVFVLVALVAPDSGITASSLRQGIALAAVFAAAPTAALARSIDAASVVALGGGMTVAGAATTPGGSLLGPIMAATGLLLLLVGASHQPSLTVGLIGKLIAYGIVLAAGMWLALGDDLLTGLAALFVALLVSLSPRWDTFKQSR